MSRLAGSGLQTYRLPACSRCVSWYELSVTITGKGLAGNLVAVLRPLFACKEAQRHLADPQGSSVIRQKDDLRAISG
jgi:hypothetical protein